MKAVSFIILFHLINIYYVLLIDGENSGLITHCQWYNRYDFDVGVIFNCNNSENEVESTKSNRNGEIYFNDADGIECFSIDKSRQRYCNKHMIDAIQFKGCSLHHIPYTTFRAYPFIRLLDISRLGLASLQPEHLQQGAKRSWDLFAQNNELREIPAFLFINAGSVVRVDLSYNKIKRIDPQGFIGANDLSSLDLSGNKIEIISEHALRGLVNLTHMNLAHNQITEIHSFAFVGLNRLYHLDISHNLISVLEDRTFANLSRLNRLQLSYNQIYLIKPYAFATALSLSRLDLSHNNITDEQIFENLYNLLHLDLSHNPINELGIGTFAKLVKLEHLDMGHTNLTDIELGTFSYSRGLISLDLSENNLKTLDFGLFLPAFRYMESLYLDGNKLSDMEGFSNSLFPRLNALGITNNNFNCTYLKQFMRSVDWEQIRLPVDRMPLNIHKTNIRGVECDTVESNVSSMEANVVSQPDNEQSNMVTAELNHAIETVIRHLPAVNAVSDSDMKIIKLPRTNGSHPNVMILVW
ncbi:leucine-rich repeat-containing protein 70-like [Sitodiplosis mosellana]|uniref:leucine-rich repeat-containing protein 70-like n=1 Tax=Sitodiplosis mosellana TaxID=263140 RepID=UPI002443B741|nr:leucine-rich repeat-containing protein 70-like [Sitodiplosis mosellana]